MRRVLRGMIGPVVAGLFLLSYGTLMRNSVWSINHAAVAGVVFYCIGFLDAFWNRDN